MISYTCIENGVPMLFSGIDIEKEFQFFCMLDMISFNQNIKNYSFQSHICLVPEQLLSHGL